MINIFYPSDPRDVVIGLKAFINTEEDIFCLMTNLRAQYIDFFSTSGKTFIKHASVEKTVQGTLDEVKAHTLAFLF